MLDVLFHWLRLAEDEDEDEVVLRDSAGGAPKGCEKADMLEERLCDEKDEDIMDLCTDMRACRARRLGAM